MTGNRFSGEICVYCNVAPSTTDDHIFARKFFLPAHRDNLPQVPACSKCNGDKAKLEAELMHILPFGARYGGGTENLSTLVPKRLAKNAKVLRRLQASITYPWVRENGLLRRTMSVPLDWTRVEELFIYMAKGVAWHEWQVRLGSEHFVSAHTMVGQEGRVLRHLIRLNAARRIAKTLSNGTFRYMGAQAADNPSITVWEFVIFGGLRSNVSGDGPCNIGVMTGPLRVNQRTAEKARRLSQWRLGTRLHDGQ
jgi:hypothetical protein